MCENLLYGNVISVAVFVVDNSRWQVAYVDRFRDLGRSEKGMGEFCVFLDRLYAEVFYTLHMEDSVMEYSICLPVNCVVSIVRRFIPCRWAGMCT